MNRKEQGEKNRKRVKDVNESERSLSSGVLEWNPSHSCCLSCTSSVVAGSVERCIALSDHGDVVDRGRTKMPGSEAGKQTY